MRKDRPTSETGVKRGARNRSSAGWSPTRRDWT